MRYELTTDILRQDGGGLRSNTSCRVLQGWHCWHHLSWWRTDKTRNNWTLRTMKMLGLPMMKDGCSYTITSSFGSGGMTLDNIVSGHFVKQFVIEYYEIRISDNKWWLFIHHPCSSGGGWHLGRKHPKTRSLYKAMCDWVLWLSHLTPMTASYSIALSHLILKHSPTSYGDSRNDAIERLPFL